MPEKRFMTKKDAITYIMEQTGVGRYAVDRKIDQLHYQGNIHIEDDPIDSRKKRITIEDVERVIQFLRGG
jgi:DNA-binding MarR family transcriptional regulator